MKGSLDFKPCTTLDQQRGSAEWCTTLRTCTMGPIVECGCCAALPGVRLDCPQERRKKPRVQMLRELLQREGRYGGDA